MIEFIAGFFIATVITLLICSVLSRNDRSYSEKDLVIHDSIQDMKSTLDQIIKKIEASRADINK